MSTKNKRITTHTLQEMKIRGEKITMLAAHDHQMAVILDNAGIEIILVAASASNVVAGDEIILASTLDQMIYQATSVVRAAERALVIVDLPFGLYQGNLNEALVSAVRIIKESGAEAIKIAGGVGNAELVSGILAAGIPLMGHLGLRDQSGAAKLKEDALKLQEAGCFAIILENMPDTLAAQVSKLLSIPVIGTGTGQHCDGLYCPEIILRTGC
ncbi:3-methyl-2-oxobutanoate hydroxymethyltransferase [Pedobacter westerhofensis]|uniref:3-methyl-2-oxobutanoate hydroxymethyltransferase n=1 Tax=Pedobacter westerhofensis TaxID=425512 RepID=A0A521FQV1_9SPHI|nr:3-methyl-2-oxobutanoate hydroxymethyltransferase [Pedobacter westerhofensis]SMO98597.1 3-methyl-2-oxobutanoate hydroxymethyltransferase [Pedobacter westerhofensis]